MLSEEGKKAKEILIKINQEKYYLRNMQEKRKYWQNLGGALKSPSLEPHLDGGAISLYAENRLAKIEDLDENISFSIDQIRRLEDNFALQIEKLNVKEQNYIMDLYIGRKQSSKGNYFPVCETEIKTFNIL